MRAKLKKSIIILGIIALINIFFLFLLKVVDVNKTGLYETTIGLSKINIGIRDLVSTSKAFDIISTIIMVIAFIIAIAEVALAVYELIKRKNIEKIDSELWALAVTYALLAFIFVFFNYALIINVRPISEGGKLESSYPSTHVLVSLTIFLTAFPTSAYLLQNKDKKYKYITYGILTFLSVMIVITRMLSGKHWFTDIVGAVLLSGFLCWLDVTFIIGIKYKKKDLF